MLGLAANIWSHQSLDSGNRYPLKDVLSSEAPPVRRFRQLVKFVANISYNNPEHVLFFRGQAKEFFKKKDGTLVSSFYPSIYRSPGAVLTEAEVEKRFSSLDKQADALLSLFKKEGIQGHDKLSKFPELVWAILQHYEVCPTPLLDLTHSLRVAASFALNEDNDEGFLYAFGFPHPNGSITYSVESELMNIRLLSICPPEAQRPYFQEGFLVGTFPARRLRKQPSLDVGVRLIAKFRLLRTRFWDNNFHAIPREALYPKKDIVDDLCDRLRAQVGYNYPTSASTRMRLKRRIG